MYYVNNPNYQNLAPASSFFPLLKFNFGTWLLHPFYPPLKFNFIWAVLSCTIAFLVRHIIWIHPQTPQASIVLLNVMKMYANKKWDMIDLMLIWCSLGAFSGNCANKENLLHCIILFRLLLKIFRIARFTTLILRTTYEFQKASMDILSSKCHVSASHLSKGSPYFSSLKRSSVFLAATKGSPPLGPC